MDYEKFKKEYESFDEYMKQSRKDAIEEFKLDSKNLPKPKLVRLEGPHEKNDAWLDLERYSFRRPPINHPVEVDDRVNSPSHYTQGTQEAIDIIEEAIADAPSIKAGMLQAQVLKYLLRLWYKDNPAEDAKKARWYLNRLIDSL